MPRPFTIAVADDVLADIRARVAAFPWHEAPEGGGWSHGTDLGYMRELAAYWLDAYDWRAAEASSNRLPQFVAAVDGLDIHYIHVRGSGRNPMPLLICHGWPGSVFEFLEIAEPLAHPERFGGDAEDGFDVVAPSLPGYGWSGKPAPPPRPARRRRSAGPADGRCARIRTVRRPGRRLGARRSHRGSGSSTRRRASGHTST